MSEPTPQPVISRSQMQQGERLHAAGRVEIVEVGPHAVRCRVLDGRRLSVALLSLGDPRNFRVQCECNTRSALCQHAWAAMLALREQAQAAAGVALPGAAPDWARRLAGIVAGAVQVPTSQRRQRELVYVVDEDRTRQLGKLVVHLLQGRRDGKPGKPRPLSPHERPDDLTELDRAACALLRSSTEDSFYLERQYELGGRWVKRLLQLLADSSRLHIATFRSGAATDLRPLPIDAGPPFVFRARLERDASGITAHGWLERDVERLEPAAGITLLGDEHALVGGRLVRTALGEAAGLAKDLLVRGSMHAAPDTADEFVASLLDLPGAASLFEGDLRVEQASEPELRILLRSEHDFRDHVLCEAKFAYGDEMVEVEHGPLVPPATSDGVWLRRALPFEAAELERMEKVAQGDLQPTGMGGCYLLQRSAWQRCVVALVGAGFRVFAEGRPLRRSTGVQVSVSSGIDWFDLRADLVLHDGGRVAVGPLLAALRKGERLVELGDGSAAMIDPEDFARVEALFAFGEPNEDGVRLQRNQAWLLDALLAAQQASVDADAAFVELRQRLAGFQALAPRQEPAGFGGALRPYQRHGLGWLHFLRELGLGGCLADDMGLGKTVQVLALLCEVHRGTDRPSLLVVPRSLLENWQREARRFAPDLRVLDFHGVDRWQRLAADPRGFGAWDLVLTTYGTLRIDVPRLEQDAVAWEYAILDEAQAIENERSLTSRAVRLLRARHRLCLTGTPVQNHIGELWALFEFLNPGLLGRSQAFRQLLGQGDELGRGFDAALLQRALAPFLLRRTKQAVLPDLPEKQEQDLLCELDGSQRERYDALLVHYRRALLHGSSKLDAKERFQALEALLRLRQAACHEGLLDEKRVGEGSAKLDALLPMLREIADSGHKALVFSQFTSFLSIVRARLDAAGLRYQYLDGRTRQRQQKVDAFQQDQGCPVFLISLKAGGTGLNLTAADYVFLLDPWWNPAAEAQAIDRAHRIGRTGKVTAYRLIARDTVEEKVLRLQQDKRELVAAVLGENQSLLAKLTREDLAALLG